MRLPSYLELATAEQIAILHESGASNSDTDTKRSKIDATIAVHYLLW